jgi:hypothetical protein
MFITPQSAYAGMSILVTGKSKKFLFHQEFPLLFPHRLNHLVALGFPSFLPFPGPLYSWSGLDLPAHLGYLVSLHRVPFSQRV